MSVEAVSAARSDQVLVPLAETSTLYPEMASPPLSAGAVQDRSIWVSPFALAVRSVGGSGASADSVSVRGTLSPALQLSPELFHLLNWADLLSASSKAKAVPSTFSVRPCVAVVRSVSKSISRFPFDRRKMK